MYVYLRTALLVSVVAAIGLTACRRETVWSGIEYTPNGSIRMAAQEPECGCSSITNVSSQPVHLTARFQGSAIGMASLQPGETLRFRFDWAGPLTEDVYVLSGTGPDDAPVNLQSAVRVDLHPRWSSCAEATCPVGTLALDLAELGR